MNPGWRPGGPHPGHGRCRPQPSSPSASPRRRRPLPAADDPDGDGVRELPGRGVGDVTPNLSPVSREAGLGEEDDLGEVTAEVLRHRGTGTASPAPGHVPRTLPGLVLIFSKLSSSSCCQRPRTAAREERGATSPTPAIAAARASSSRGRTSAACGSLPPPRAATPRAFLHLWDRPLRPDPALHRPARYPPITSAGTLPSQCPPVPVPTHPSTLPSPVPVPSHPNTFPYPPVTHPSAFPSQSLPIPAPSPRTGTFPSPAVPLGITSRELEAGEKLLGGFQHATEPDPTTSHVPSGAEHPQEPRDGRHSPGHQRDPAPWCSPALR